jgi:hypothetical protein
VNILKANASARARRAQAIRDFCPDGAQFAEAFGRRADIWRFSTCWVSSRIGWRNRLV